MKSRRILVIKNLTLILVLFATPSSQAMRLALIEMETTKGPILHQLHIDNALTEKPKPQLNVFPESNEDHKQFVDILSAGIPFDAQNVRDQVATILQGFPEVCKPRLFVSMIVGPIGDIDRFVPGVKDKRRIWNISVGNCLGEQISECKFNIFDTGDFDFGLSDLTKFLKKCRDATNLDIENGAELAK